VPAFTFEIVQQSDASVVAHNLMLSSEQPIWCHVEALALDIQNRGRAFIRVKNSVGETVVRTGVTTALASIEKCSRADCPIKTEFEQRVSAARLAVASAYMEPRTKALLAQTCYSRLEKDGVTSNSAPLPDLLSNSQPSR
jgi:hypothetical protein